MIYYDGSTYEGEWVAGYENGKGKSVDEEGAVYEGDWDDGSK